MSSSPTTSAGPPPFPAQPALPPTTPSAPQPGDRPAQPLSESLVQPPPSLPPLHVRDEFYPYGDGRIAAQQNYIQMFPSQPSLLPPNISYSPYQAPAFYNQTLASVNPAYTWPSHLPSSGQDLGGRGVQHYQLLQ